MARMVETIEQFPVHDEVISAWFAELGWPVTARFIDHGRGVFAWRYAPNSGTDSRTLRVTETVLEDVPPIALVEFMRNANVNAVLSRENAKYVLVQRLDNGSTGVRVYDGPPR